MTVTAWGGLTIEIQTIDIILQGLWVWLTDNTVVLYALQSMNGTSSTAVQHGIAVVQSREHQTAWAKVWAVEKGSGWRICTATPVDMAFAWLYDRCNVAFRRQTPVDDHTEATNLITYWQRGTGDGNCIHGCSVPCVCRKFVLSWKWSNSSDRNDRQTAL